MATPGDYPIPHYAAYLWVDGADLHLGLPSGPDTKASTLTIPATPQGLALCLQILREREAKPQDLRLGTKGAITQWELEHLLRGWTPPKAKLKPGNEALDQLGPPDFQFSR